MNIKLLLFMKVFVLYSILSHSPEFDSEKVSKFNWFDENEENEKNNKLLCCVYVFICLNMAKSH